MSADFIVAKGDLLPVFPFQCRYESGAFVDLTGTTVRFVMEIEGGTTPKIDTATGVSILNPVLDPGSMLPHGTYSWASTDTDTPGDYIAWIVVTFPSGKKLHCPNSDNYLRIQVTAVP